MLQILAIIHAILVILCVIHGYGRKVDDIAEPDLEQIEFVRPLPNKATIRISLSDYDDANTATSSITWASSYTPSPSASAEYQPRCLSVLSRSLRRSYGRRTRSPLCLEYGL